MRTVAQVQRYKEQSVTPAQCTDLVQRFRSRSPLPWYRRFAHYDGVDHIYILDLDAVWMPVIARHRDGGIYMVNWQLVRADLFRRMINVLCQAYDRPRALRIARGIPGATVFDHALLIHDKPVCVIGAIHARWAEAREAAAIATYQRLALR